MANNEMRDAWELVLDKFFEDNPQYLMLYRGMDKNIVIYWWLDYWFGPADMPDFLYNGIRQCLPMRLKNGNKAVFLGFYKSTSSLVIDGVSGFIVNNNRHKFVRWTVTGHLIGASNQDYDIVGLWSDS